MVNELFLLLNSVKNNIILIDVFFVNLIKSGEVSGFCISFCKIVFVMVK